LNTFVLTFLPNNAESSGDNNEIVIGEAVVVVEVWTGFDA